ncbi:hypothetical protein D5086_021693 [Populus alba]|uniref:Uncharacterized protein n=1 Tax=Populus alba TaxID=43335 RepID=A0ACC4BCW2_POPAL
MAKNKKKTTSSRRSPVRGSSPDKYLICPEKNEVIVAEKAISLSTADHVLVEDCSDCDAFEEDEVDYSISEYASGGSSKFFRSPTPIPAIGKLDLPSGEELVAPPPQPLGDSGKSASNAAPPAQHASSPEGLSNKAGLPTGPSQERRVSALQRLGKVLQTNKEHDKEHAEAAHTKKGNDKGQPEVIRNNMGNDKGKTVVGDTCLDPMHMEADEWETHVDPVVSPCRLAVPPLVSFLFGWLVVALPLVPLDESLSAVVVSLRGCCYSSFISMSACGVLVVCFCWHRGVQFDDARIAGREFSLGVIKLVICMALIG